jgi:hypothetical protein
MGDVPYLSSHDRETHGAALVTADMQFAGGVVLREGTVVELVVPSKDEQNRLDGLASRDWPDPSVLALWEGRTRILPQHSLRAMDHRASDTMFKARRKSKT